MKKSTAPSNQRQSARCRCGRVRLTAIGMPLRVGVCHCRDCQRQHGAAFYAAAIFHTAQVEVQGQTSNYLGRHFCPLCGSHLFALSDDEIEVHLGALDSPTAYQPTYEKWTEHRLAWVNISLTKHQHQHQQSKDT